MAVPRKEVKRQAKRRADRKRWEKFRNRRNNNSGGAFHKSNRSSGIDWLLGLFARAGHSRTSARKATRRVVRKTLNDQQATARKAIEKGSWGGIRKAISAGKAIDGLRQRLGRGTGDK